MSLVTSTVLKFKREQDGRRNLKKVPYVEMFDGRIQGVVSSGSSATRVYCSWIDEDGDYYCSTNNNRRCGGLRGGGCKHIDSMISNAIFEFGGHNVARYLGIEGEPGEFRSANSITRHLTGTQKKAPANEVFSRFLNYLSYMELPADDEPMPEMAFFITG